MSHANARLTPAGRLIMVRRIATGRPVAHVASELGVSRTTAWRWWRRFQEHGPAGLVDRSSVARSHPRHTPACTETRVRIIRALSRRGPVFIGGRLGIPASTAGRILTRHGAPLLRELDPVTGRVIRASRRTANRYEHDHPGSLVHVDVEEARPDPRRRRVAGAGPRCAPERQTRARVRLRAYRDRRSLPGRVRGDPRRRTRHHRGRVPGPGGCVLYATLGVRIERVITDNAFAYRHSVAFHDVAAAHGIQQRFIRPHCPWTNGKVERLNRTLATEWAYSRPFGSNHERAAALPRWLDYYNLNRPHLGIGGHSPIDRIIQRW